MADIEVTVEASGAAYISLVVGDPPEVRESVPLDALEEAGALPALENIALDFDFYGRLIGLRITNSVDTILVPSMREAAEGAT